MLTWLCSMAFSLSSWADRAVYILIIFAREKEKEEVSYALVLKCVLTFLSLFISTFAMIDKGQGCIISKKGHHSKGHRMWADHNLAPLQA